MVGSTETSPKVSRDSRNSLVGPGKSSSLRVSRRVRELPSRERLGLLGGHLARRRLPGAARQRLGAERLGPAARRVAELAVEEADHRVGDVEPRRVLGELGRVGAEPDQGQREVADHLRGGGHLGDVAEHVVGGGVHLLDLLELLAQPEGDRLLAQVGELAAGDLVAVDPAGGRGQPGLERRVDPADRLPVGLHRVDGGERQPGLARGVVGRADQRRERRLRGRAGHRRAGRVDGVDPGVDGGEQRAELAAGRCRGCAGAPGRSNRSRSAVTRVRAAGARSSPAMSLIASTCAPAATIRSASRR